MTTFYIILLAQIFNNSMVVTDGKQQPPFPEYTINSDLFLEETNQRIITWITKDSMEKLMEKLTCVFCGKEYPQGTPSHGDKILVDHIKICEKHPMRALEIKLKELEIIKSDIKKKMEVAQKLSNGMQTDWYLGHVAAYETVLEEFNKCDTSSDSRAILRQGDNELDSGEVWAILKKLVEKIKTELSDSKLKKMTEEIKIEIGG